MEVGNGENTIFWRDIWIKDVPLEQLFPSIFKLTVNKNISVKDVRLGNQETTVWNIKLTRNLYDWEVDEWMVFLKLLYEWKGKKEGEDRPMWRRAKTGKFSVKDNYLRLAEPTQRNNTRPGPWKGLWNTGCPTKVAFFTWEVVLEKVLTVDNLKRRGLIITNRCYLCKSAEETVNHLFLRCEWAGQLWKTSFTTIGIHWVQAQSTKKELWAWQTVGKNKLKRKMYRKIPMLIWWLLWIERNRRVFLDKETTMGSIIDRWLTTLNFWVSGKSVDSVFCIFDCLDKLNLVV